MFNIFIIESHQHKKKINISSITTSSMIEEVSAQYLKELHAEKEELEKNCSEAAHAIKLLQNGEQNSTEICEIFSVSPRNNSA